jgi:hypothetical protein
MQAKNFGGSIYSGPATTTLNLLISSGVIDGSESENQGSFIYVNGLASASVTTVISSTTLSCKTASMWSTWPITYNTIISNLDASVHKIGGAFYYENGVSGTITSSSNTFKQCYTTTEGSVFYLSSSGMTFTDSLSNF